MGIRMVGKKEFQDAKSLCEGCNNAVPQMCPYIKASSNYEAVLEKMGAEAVKVNYNSNHNSGSYYKVVRCPYNAAGNLPRITETKHEAEREIVPEDAAGQDTPESAKERDWDVPEAVAKRYDLSCPKCGEVKGVRIAWAKYLKPKEWYCRCDKCKSGFKPRKRGRENMTLRNDFYRVMTKEKYLELRAQGITSDAKVLAAMELPYNSFIKFLTEAKKKWGIAGKKVGQAAEKKEAGAGEAGNNVIPLKENQDTGAVEKREQGTINGDAIRSALSGITDERVSKIAGVPQGFGISIFADEAKTKYKNVADILAELSAKYEADYSREIIVQKIEPLTPKQIESLNESLKKVREGEHSPSIDIGEDSSPLKDCAEDSKDDLLIEDPADDDDEAIFISPFKSACNTPVLRFYKNGINLSVAASQLLKGARFVRVGALKSGAIVLVASDTADGCYVLGSKNSAGGMKIGGGAMVRELQRLGAKMGRYVLEFNAGKKRFEAREKVGE